ncbi:MAG: glycerol-3-phosphate dehydrogenase/oxidase [Anaerolineaceae bacterium]|nr:glycerol-3-phosphate dehydrogenase/oxidase [Anaerolineaceae bacterium]
MNPSKERQSLWSAMDQPWDMIIVGGGITGAGILRLAGLYGLKALLLEGRDFAFGTSSRSSKLVHGGFRYLRNGQFNVTYESVREREWLLAAAPALVTRLPFLLPVVSNPARKGTPGWQLGLGVWIYDLMGARWDHQHLDSPAFIQQCPSFRTQGLDNGYRYYDAQVDDARLVLRLLHEAVCAGGNALNYARVERLLRTADGQVCGVLVRDTSSPAGQTLELHARLVINATGPWGDELRSQVSGEPRLRKLRGSHLVFKQARFPVDQAVTLFHPRDNRAFFVLPWEGTTVAGTTDVDHTHQESWDEEPFAGREEIAYLLEALRYFFPSLDLSENDVLSSFAGLRPIVKQGDMSPSKASRAHSLWQEDGLLTITGGKLTTFRRMARHVLEAARSYLPDMPARPAGELFDPLPQGSPPSWLSPGNYAYLAGRYGADTPAVLAACAGAGGGSVPGLPTRWGELSWAAGCEWAEHLDDLLLRRTRLGLLLPNGGLDCIHAIRLAVQPVTGWHDARWEQEVARYSAIWERFYSPYPAPVGSLTQATRLRSLAAVE